MAFRSVCQIGLVVALATGLCQRAAWAQGQSAGSIAGVVKDGTGAVLPGVTVEASSPALIEKTRSVVTDGAGLYKVIDLRPGTYSVTFTLVGFSTVRREGIELTAAFTANVNADLTVGAVTETITVSGESPIVDTQSVVQKATATREMMNVLPTDRNFVSFAAMTPGVFVTGVTQNVGGSLPEIGNNLVIHGSRNSDSVVMEDGMAIINGQGNGGLQYGSFPNNGITQEITFQTDSHPAEFERASVVSNVILKEGSNFFRGSFQGRFSNGSLEATNLDAGQIAAGLKSGNRIEKIWDINPAGGGPIIKDRLWLYSAYRHWGTYNTVAGSFKDASFSEILYQPSTEQTVNPVWHQSAANRLTAQVTPKNKINAFYDYQYTLYGTCVVPDYLTAISACAYSQLVPNYTIQASWSSPVTNKLLFEAGGLGLAIDFHGQRQPGVSATQFSINDPLAPAGMPQTWGSSATGYGFTRSNQFNYRGSMSYVTGSHAFKTGFTLMHTWRYNTQEPNNSVSLNLRAGVPFQITQYATPIQYHETMNYNMGLYAQDQWRVNRLTLNYGLRIDFLNTQVDPQDIAGGPFTPPRNYAAVENVPNWRDIDPRVGVAYDLFGNGKTAIKASLGRYVVGDAYTIARAVNPEFATVNTTLRTWSDPSGTFNPFNDCDVFNPAANGGCGPLLSPTFGTVGPLTTTYDPSIVTGTNKRPYNWEGQVSIQHELLPRLSVYVAYSRRSYGNLFATQNQAVSNASYTQYCINAPVDSRLPNGGGFQECGLFDINRVTTPNNVVQSSNNFGHIEDVYDGIDFDLNARLGPGIIVSGGVSSGRERTNSCDLKDDVSLVFQSGIAALTGTAAGIVAPRLTAFCDVHPPLQPNVKGQVAYPLPWWGISASATIQSLPGPQLGARYPLSNALVASSLGRNFVGPAPTVDLVAPGTMFGDRINETDIRFSKVIKAGRTTIRPSVSVYNLFNANPISTYNNVYGPAWLAPTVIMTPRFVDFGVQLDF